MERVELIFTLLPRELYKLVYVDGKDYNDLTAEILKLELIFKFCRWGDGSQKYGERRELIQVARVIGDGGRGTTGIKTVFICKAVVS